MVRVSIQQLVRIYSSHKKLFQYSEDYPSLTDNVLIFQRHSEEKMYEETEVKRKLIELVKDKHNGVFPENFQILLDRMFTIAQQNSSETADV